MFSAGDVTLGKCTGPKCEEFKTIIAARCAVVGMQVTYEDKAAEWQKFLDRIGGVGTPQERCDFFFMAEGPKLPKRAEPAFNGFYELKDNEERPIGGELPNFAAVEAEMSAAPKAAAGSTAADCARESKELGNDGNCKACEEGKEFDAETMKCEEKNEESTSFADKMWRIYVQGGLGPKLANQDGVDGEGTSEAAISGEIWAGALLRVAGEGHQGLFIDLGLGVFGTAFQAIDGNGDYKGEHYYTGFGLRVGLSGQIALSKSDYLALSFGVPLGFSYIEMVTDLWGPVGEENDEVDGFGVFWRPELAYIRTFDSAALKVYLSALGRIDFGAGAKRLDFANTTDTKGGTFEYPVIFNIGVGGEF